MERETVVYRGKKYHRYPLSKRRQLRVYFWRHDKWKSPPIALHRQIWVDAFGDVPKGFIIHHKNEDPLDNSLENLAAVSPSEHTREHFRLDPARREQARQNYKNFFLPSPLTASCEECGKSFTFTRKAGARFCGRLCGQRSWWKRRGSL